jgi:hypothetical protein
MPPPATLGTGSAARVTIAGSSWRETCGGVAMQAGTASKCGAEAGLGRHRKKGGAHLRGTVCNWKEAGQQAEGRQGYCTQGDTPGYAQGRWQQCSPGGWPGTSLACRACSAGASAPASSAAASLASGLLDVAASHINCTTESDLHFFKASSQSLSGELFLHSLGGPCMHVD